MRQHALGHSPAHFFPTFRCRGLRRRAKLGEAIPREAGRSETRSSRRQRPWGGSCIPARHQINQRCHRRTRGSDAKSSSTKRKTRSGLNDPSDRVAVAAPEDFAAPSTNDRICDCGGAWKAAAAQQTYFCERAQRELGISATGSVCAFAAVGTEVCFGLTAAIPLTPPPPATPPSSPSPGGPGPSPGRRRGASPRRCSPARRGCGRASCA